jgi:hypothetical protein
MGLRAARGVAGCSRRWRTGGKLVRDGTAGVRAGGATAGRTVVRRRGDGGAKPVLRRCEGGATAARTVGRRRRERQRTGGGPTKRRRPSRNPMTASCSTTPIALHQQLHAVPTTHPLAASPTSTTRRATRRSDRRVRPNRRPPPHHRHQRWSAPCVRALPPAAPARYRAARRAVAQFGSATGLGPVGRRFKSGQPDQFGVRERGDRVTRSRRTTPRAIPRSAPATAWRDPASSPRRRDRPAAWRRARPPRPAGRPVAR